MLAAAGLIIYRLCNEVTSTAGNSLRYLMLQTSYGEHHWTPPKGHVDPGEELLETAVRETVEESGLNRDCFTINESFTPLVLRYNVKGREKTVTYWLARANDSAIVRLSDEHQDFRWCGIDEACHLVAFPDMQEALRKAHIFLSENERA